MDTDSVYGLHKQLLVSICSKDHPDGVRMLLQCPLQKFNPRHAGHTMVGYDDGYVVSLHNGQSVLAIRRRKDIVLLPEYPFQSIQITHVIIHQQNAMRFITHGYLASMEYFRNTGQALLTGSLHVQIVDLPELFRMVADTQDGIGYLRPRYSSCYDISRFPKVETSVG